MLQVVENPASSLPYLAVLFMSLGLLFHFALNLRNFIRRRERAATAAA